MPDLIVVDTDVAIDAGRGVGEALACLQEIDSQSALATSVVTQMELMIGCRNRTELRVLERFLSRFFIIKLDSQISDIAVALLRRYRLSHGLLIADALIAATAMSLDLPLVSKNQRDYRFIAGLNTLGYPQPFAT